jgi:hypothetical protein
MSHELCWPFEIVRNVSGRESGWIALHGPIANSDQQQQFAELRRSGARFAGVSSYLDFPRHRASDWLDYQAACEAWCHCFRDPSAYLSPSIPHALISVSDFTDWVLVSRIAAQGSPHGQHDYVYFAGIGPWKKRAKNWGLAARCIPELFRDMALTALVIGEPDQEFPPQQGVVFSPPLAWPDLLAEICRAKFLFVPSLQDPSPRVIAEALCLNVPVLVYEDILGGWKYVNRFTGRFFSSERDVVAAARSCVEGARQPRDWFRSHYGPILSGGRLTKLLRPLDRSLPHGAVLGLSPAGPHVRQAVQG